MQIRPMELRDLDRLPDIDGTIESSDYLHLDRRGERLAITWSLEVRRLRERLIASNALSDADRWNMKQVIEGIEEGVALFAEHDGDPVAALLAVPVHETGVLRIVDLRVDYDQRRQGIATAMVYQAVQHARDAGRRAVWIESRTNNLPAGEFLLRAGFELMGVDGARTSNHDLVKESATLEWYMPLD
jgi:ribosomal protein S18 acetylase RimI-like enzyme